MGRAQLLYTVKDQAGNVIQNAAVNVYEPGTSDPIAGMWDAKTGGSAAPNPLISNAQGEIEAWLDVAQSVDLVITDNADTAFYPSTPASKLSWTSFSEARDVYPAPGDIPPIGHNHDAAYVNEADHTKAAHDALNIDADTLDGFDAGVFAPAAHNHDGAYSAIGHSHTKQKVAFTLGRAGGIPPAVTNEAADFWFIVPFNTTLEKIKVTSPSGPTALTTFQIRRSTDGGASWANAFGSVDLAANAETGTADPTDLAVNEGDLLNFSVTVGGGSGTNPLVQVIGTPA